VWFTWSRHHRRVDQRLTKGNFGLNSIVRPVLFPGQPGPRYSGYTSWRGVTAGPVTLPEGGGETWGRGERFGLVPMADGRVYWYATSNEAQGRTFPDEHAEVRRRFGGWHPPIADVLAATPPGAVCTTTSAGCRRCHGSPPAGSLCWAMRRTR
jgi:2-polyprenyl-6-methoxyphenol hydroxylase-like FAD-dependent oxidoreductase